jgi:hypothetical protein
MHAARLGVRGRAAGLWVLPVAALVVVVANTVSARWSQGPASQDGTASSGPSMVRARSVAAQEFGLLAGGGWAQAWTLWSAEGQAAMRQADFVRLNTECRPALGEPYVIDAATDVDTTTVRIDWHQDSMTASSSVVYEQGAWRFQPDAQTLAAYRGGVAAVVAERRAAGACR